MTPQNRARMREVVGRAVRIGLFPGGAGPHETVHGHGANDAGVDTLPMAAIPGTASAAAPAKGLPPIERFTAALEALAGAVHRARSLQDVVEIVVAQASRLRATQILAWSDEATGLPGLTAALAARGLACVAGDIPQPNGPARAEALATLAQIPLGVTGADAGFSETGTIVLATGPGRPRMASLLVPTHIATLRVDRLVDSVSTLLVTRRDLVDAGSNFVCITGPSRTADIEHTLSRGVHGPGDVHVILLDA